MVEKPLFYQYLDQFQTLIGIGTPTALIPFCDSYLDHYHINFVQTQLARHYQIGSTTIGPYTIVSHYWEPTSEADKTLIINHGYFDHTGLYGQLINWGLTHHYRVISYDLPGHGLSSGERAAIDSFDDYSEVLAHIIDNTLNQYPNTTIDLIGQSTGGAVITHYLLTHPQAPIRNTTLLAPLVRSHGWAVLRWVYFFCRMFLSHIPRRFIDSSHNQAFNQFLQYQDPLQAYRIPLSWLGAMEQWSQKIAGGNNIRPYQGPVQLIQGTGDHTVDWRHNISALKQHFAKLECHYIDKAQHQLVNESEEYWQQVKQRLEQTLKSD